MSESLQYAGRAATVTARTGPTLAGIAVPNLLLVGLMWVLEAVDTVTGHALDAFGIRPRDVADSWTILVAPLLHYGWQHLANNSVLLLVLGVLLATEGVRRWVQVTLWSVVCSGVVVWLVSPPGSLTLGASGLVFGWLAYLLVRGFYSRRPGQVMLAGVLLMLYGGVLWGVLPTTPSVSWQGHLGGAVGGVLAARSLRHRKV